MKRVVDGVAYNTATATRIAVTHYDHEADHLNPASRGTITLYQTRGGAFFTVDDGEKSVWIAREREHDQRLYVVFSAIDAERAREGLKHGEWEIIDTNFAAFPEAEVEPKDDKPATLYVRMPASLKTRIDGAAQDEGVSANVMAMRCLEKCLGGDEAGKSELANAYNFLVMARAHWEDGWSDQQIFDMIEDAISEIESSWKARGWNGAHSGYTIGDDLDVVDNENASKKYQPFTDPEVRDRKIIGDA